MYHRAGNSINNGGRDIAELREVEEIRSAVNVMKNNKAPGADNITAELLKLGGDVVVQWLLKLVSVAWQEESVPEDWTKQLTIPLHKKGSYQDCDNYRGIALLIVPGKVFCKVVQTRLSKTANHLLRENQCGFRTGRGCVDQIFNLRILAEKAREFNTPLFLSFVDLRKAYDSVNREALWSVLESKYQLPGKLVRILRALHHNTKGAIRAYGQTSNEFTISTGVRQGDVLAPVLFNLFFDAIIAATITRHPDVGFRVMYNIGDPLVGSRRKMKNQVTMSDLEYADDMALIADSMGTLEEVLLTLHTTWSGMGLSINTKKTKNLAICPSSSSTSTPRPVQLSEDSQPIAVVDHFEYLGSTIAQDCSLDLEISLRISKASNTFRSLYKVLWSQRRLKAHTKLRLFKSVILPTLLYGSEAWAPLSAHTARLQGFITGCVRVILGLSRWDNTRNTELRARAGIARTEVLLMERRLRWLGHVERMDNSRLPKCLLVCRPEEGKRSLGGQKRRWCDVVQDDLKSCHLLADWRQAASRREAWRGVVKLAADELNQGLEEAEKKRKDQQKRRREEGIQPSSPLYTCDVQQCPFVSLSKAGLTNHKRQKHGPAAQSVMQCKHCKKSFKKQGFKMHTKYCQAKSKGST